MEENGERGERAVDVVTVVDDRNGDDCSGCDGDGEVIEEVDEDEDEVMVKVDKW